MPLVTTKIFDTTRGLERTREQTARSHADVIHTIYSKIDSLSEELPKRLRLSALRSGRKIQFMGHDRSTILMPLLLCQPRIRSAIRDLIFQYSESAGYLSWLGSELDTLVSSVIQENAIMSQGSTATSFDEWDYQGEGKILLSREDVLHKASAPTLTRKPYLKRCSARTDVGLERVPPRKKIKPTARSFSVITPVGKIAILIPRLSAIPGEYSDSHEPQQAGFSFSPEPHICSTILIGKFSNIMNAQQEPRLCAQLNAFTRYEPSRSHWTLFERGTLEDVDNALRTGDLSPYAYDDINGNMCHFVSYN